jgi:threonine dehydrogenase-like Zn-dependent dehydrogenase
VPERLELARRYDVETLDLGDFDGGISDEIRARTDGRGADATIDAVGMEAHGAPIGKLAQTAAGLLPDAAARKLIETAGVDRLSALHGAIDSVRRGGTVSISGVYGGTANPVNLMQLFDKQLQLRMGQANVKRWVPEIMPLLEDESDPLGTEDLATHKIAIDDAPEYYEKFQKKEDGAIKIVIQP